MTTSTQTITIRDRNRIAYYLAFGFACNFIPRPDGGLDAEFVLSETLEEAARSYNQNHPVPVQSFVAACRYISDAIQSHRQRSAVKGGGHE